MTKEERSTDFEGSKIQLSNSSWLLAKTYDKNEPPETEFCLLILRSVLEFFNFFEGETEGDVILFSQEVKQLENETKFCFSKSS